MLIRAIPVCLLLVTLGAEPLAQGDRDFAASQLHATRKLFLDTVVGVSERQWTFKPAPDVWSLAEIAEHITKAEQTLFQMATATATKNPLDTEKKQRLSNRQKDEAIGRMVSQRNQKAQAPETLKPTGMYPSRQDLLSAFRARRDATIAYVLNTTDELRGHFAPHPALGDMDAYQWLLMLSAHTERHVNQMKELQARPDYPRN